MRKCKHILPMVFLLLTCFSCNQINTTETQAAVRFQDTPTIVDNPTKTPFPTTTPVPTLIPAVKIKEADQALFTGDWEKAFVEYSQSYTTDVESPDQVEANAAALLGIGRTYYQMGEFEQSLTTLKRQIAEYPRSSLVGATHFAAAQAFEKIGMMSEAADAYGSYLKLRPGLIDSYVLEWQGDALAEASQEMKAIDVYQAAITSPRLGDSLGVELKIANAYADLGDYPTAILTYQDIYTRTTDEYTRAQIDLVLGRINTASNQMEQAYEVYLDAVENYPVSYDTYQALIVLVEAGYPVSEFDRGLVDFFAGQYSLSIAAFDRYLVQSTENAGTAYYYKGLAFRALDDPPAAINTWRVLIESYPEDDHWSDAWEETAYTQWAYLEQYPEAVQTLLKFAANNPTHPRAPEFLFEAARVSERDRDYVKAAEIWSRIPTEYPTSSHVSRAIFLAAISHYREGDFNAALSSFEWSLNSSSGPEQKSAAYFWLAKTYQALGNTTNADVFFRNAANEDPTGYYSERARDLLAGEAAFEPPLMYDLIFDHGAEREDAEAWMRAHLSIPDGIDLTIPGNLANDLRFVRGTELWNLGLYQMAREEFESLRGDIHQSPMDNYRLANHLLGLGLYRTAVFAARQILDLNGMSDAETLSAAKYFNHIRFGPYYKDLVITAGEVHDLHPLFLFSILRQESLYEGFVRSTAGARGLMQIMPATGESIAANLGWPPGYTEEDLYRPVVSINFGADYLDAQLDYFNGDYYAALAAYNAGPGNTLIWLDLAGGDPDLFLEIIRFPETQDYIRGIYEVFSIYHLLYDRTP